MSEELLNQISNMQALIETVSLNLQSFIQEFKKYLETTDNESEIGFQQNNMLNNLQNLQNVWKQIKPQLKKDEQELPPINHSFHIYFDNKMKILVKEQIKEIVKKINLHADQFGLKQILEPSPIQSNSPMELEQLQQGDQNI